MIVDDTIVAIASAAAGSGARAIVRLSGPNAIAILERFSNLRASGDAKAPHRRPLLLQLEQPIGELPCDVYLWPTQRSFTRQPCVELHLPGCLPIAEAVVRNVCQHGGRPAGPGEFTMRAFLAGRIDLAQAEAVLGVIDAEDRASLDRALAQLAGGLSTPLQALRNDLLDLCADVEAGLDFVDEDIEFVDTAAIVRRLTDADVVLCRVQTQIEQREDVVRRQLVVLYGRPNAGKSSLWNAFLTNEPGNSGRAIVTAQAGTTRDYLAAEVQWDGIPITLIDTAGIGTSPGDKSSSVTIPAIRQLQEAAEQATLRQTAEADLLVLCVDGTQRRDAWELAELDRQQHFSASGGHAAAWIVVSTKHDQPSAHCSPVRIGATYSSEAAGANDTSASVFATPASYAAPGILLTSAQTGLGLAELRELICDTLRQSRAESDSAIASSATRCLDNICRAREAIQSALAVSQDRAEELVAADLRAALEEIGKVVGVVYTDDILDRIFSRFCIGK